MNDERATLIRATADAALRLAGVQPDSSYHWLLPPELIEDTWEPDDRGPKMLAGINVRMEVMLGERRMMLIHTVADVIVDDPVPASRMSPDELTANGGWGSWGGGVPAVGGSVDERQANHQEEGAELQEPREAGDSLRLPRLRSPQGTSGAAYMERGR